MMQEKNHQDHAHRLFPVVQEYWSGVPGNNRNGNGRSNGGGWFGGRSAAEEQHIEPRSPLPTQPHDIAFCASEGDFQVRQGRGRSLLLRYHLVWCRLSSFVGLYQCCTLLAFRASSA